MTVCRDRSRRGTVDGMPEDAAAKAPPPFVVRMRRAIDEAVARHGDQVGVQHLDYDGQGPYGWESQLRLAGHPQVEASFWYDGGDQDLMLLGDVPHRGWSLVAEESEWVADDESFVLDEDNVQVCLREVQEVVDDLAGPGWDVAVAQAALRQRLDARPGWQRLLFPRAAQRWP